MDMTIDKQNGNIFFNEKTHSYHDLSDPSKKFISVTTLIHKFEPVFDANFWSSYKAVEKIVDPDLWKAAKRILLSTKTCDERFLKMYDIPVDVFNAAHQKILDDWQKENFASTTRGTEIHSNLEQSFYKQKTDISLQKYGLGGRFTCLEGDNSLDLENGIYPEYLVHYDSPDNKIHVAGQIDLLVKQGNAFSIIDWKGLPISTPIPTINGWKLMKDINIGDKVFDSNGNLCAVTHKSETHYNPCYQITFDDSFSITADHEHRWLVNEMPNDIPLDRESGMVLTTKKIADYMEKFPDKRLVIREAEALKLPDDPSLTTGQFPIPRTDYEAVELMQSVMRGSILQRRNALHAVGDFLNFHYVHRELDSVFHRTISELARTLGYDFLRTEHNIIYGRKPYRIITEVTQVPTVATQCIEVDSLDHTYLCTRELLVTHNTNKQIKTSSYYNKTTNKSEKLEYPLNDLDSCNYSVYNMQLSTYAWMIQQLKPEWECKELKLVHFDHNNKMTVYDMKYLKEHVEKMLNFWKKQSVLESHRAKRQPIEY